MITYSVWNYGTQRYDYYVAPGDHPTHAGAPPHRERTRLGSSPELVATPEQAAWPLPAGAKKIGSGDFAKGRIASTSAGGVLGGVELSDPVAVGAMAVLAYVIWKNRRHIL